MGDSNKNFMAYLNGRRENEILKDGNSVIRPIDKCTPHIHMLLKHLTPLGFSKSPQVLALSEKNETLEFMQGHVYKEDLPKQIMGDDVLFW